MPFSLMENVEDASWIHLNEGEQVRWTGRPSKWTLAVGTAVALVLIVVGLVATWWFRPFVDDQGWPALIGLLPLVIALAGLVYGLIRYLHWLRLLYVITDEEIYVKIGLVSRDVTQVPMTRVQNTSFDQTVVQRLLSYGTIDVFTAGTDTQDISFVDVPNPEVVKGTLTSQIREAHGMDDGGV